MFIVLVIKELYKTRRLLRCSLRLRELRKWVIAQLLTPKNKHGEFMTTGRRSNYEIAPFQKFA